MNKKVLEDINIEISDSIIREQLYLNLCKICSRYGITVKKVDNPQEAGWIDSDGNLHKQLFSLEEFEKKE